MSIDRREDAGDFYPGGKVISTRPVATGGDVKHSDFANVEPLPERFTDEDVRMRFNQLVSAAKGASAAVVVMLLGATAFGAGVTVQTAPKGRIYNDEQIVTNVVFDATGLAPGNYATVSNAAMSAVQPTNMPMLAMYPMRQWGENIYIAGDEYIDVSTKYHGTIAHRIFDGWRLSLSTDFWDQFSDVALSGSYNDLTDTPEIPSAADFSPSNAMLVATIAGAIAPLAGIPALIPAQASPTNQLADKQFVNSSIATSTANFCGTSAATNEDAFVEWLEAIEVANDNDYVFWQTEDGDGNAVFKRYKYVEDPNGLGEEALAGHWLFEYDLNNSSFTAVQWAAINSGVTPEAVAKIANAATKAEAEALRNDKLDKSAVVAPSTSSSDSGKAADAKATGDALEPLLFAQYYPDGSVKSAAEFTAGIKYGSFDDVHRTVFVLPFCNTGTAENDNSNLSGRVVIPPFVDNDGNPYISDDGTRFKVVGVNSGLPEDGNDNLTAVVAPNTVTIIGYDAFAGCSSLTSVSLPAATSIGGYAFSYCFSLASASLPAATSIGENAFFACTSLPSITLPAVTNISEYAFGGCSSLASVDFGDTPRSSVPSLGEDAFYNVPNACKIIVPDAQYDAWIAAQNWSTLYADGYKFLRHSEWEYVRRYELADYSTEVDARLNRSGIDALRDMESRLYVVTTNVVVSSGDGWTCDWDGVTLDMVSAFRWADASGMRVLTCQPYEGIDECLWHYIPNAKSTGGVTYQTNGSLDDTVLDFAISDDNHLTFTRVMTATNIVVTTNYVIRVAPVDIPAGRTDVDAHDCVHNAPVELGLDAKATVDLSGLSSNAIVRSVSTAIGPGADASNPDNPSMQQGIAVGNQARAKGTNAIAIGAGVRHEDEDDLTGDNVYAGANEAIAGGYSAKATASKAVALGSRARASAQGAWQLGEGVNSNRNTLAFRDYQLLGEDGQVPYERVAGAVAQAGVEFEAAVSNAVRRVLAGGNMAVVGDGSEGEQILEPKVGGLSEVEFVPNTNGQYEASTLVYLDPPPQAARNYDILISEIPEPMWLGTNGWETVALENRLRVGFTDLPPQYGVTMHVDESCGFPSSPRVASVTNAPTIVKVREVSTNKVLVVVKPYRLEDL